MKKGEPLSAELLHQEAARLREMARATPVSEPLTDNQVAELLRGYGSAAEWADPDVASALRELQHLRAQPPDAARLREVWMAGWQWGVNAVDRYGETNGTAEEDFELWLATQPKETSATKAER